MKFDIFFSISQTEVDGHTPDDKTMFQNFFDQVRLSDELGFGTAWVAETHLSTETQKENSKPVVPHFKGEIGLNTDILQLAHKVFSMTERINVGSAIRNILCNGGPLAHAEGIKTFLSLHKYSNSNPDDNRKLNIGFASGRFDFSNTPYGIRPRNELEELVWRPLKGQILRQGTEIFLRALRGDEFSSEDLQPIRLTAQNFRATEEWEAAFDKFAEVSGKDKIDLAGTSEIEFKSFWQFEKVGVIPKEAPLEYLNLTLGSHDVELQEFANTFLPVGVFNLSITPPKVIEETHERMAKVYHKGGGPWQRHMMPRTCLIYIDETTEKAKEAATKAWANYWTAMEGTLDPKKVEQAVGNTLAGTPEELVEQIKEKYHQDDRLMLWFDFNNHNNEFVKKSMRTFIDKVAPHLN